MGEGAGWEFERDDRRIRDLPPEERLRIAGLTPREIEVSLMTARGMLAPDVAVNLSVAESTLKSLLARVREKLGYRTTRDMVTDFIRRGLVRPEELRDPSAE